MSAVQDFDATVDRINRVLALLTAQMEHECTQVSPNQNRIEAIRHQQDYFIEARKSLNINDPTQIAALWQECIDLLRDERSE
jgi:hypothetical protein